MFALKKEEKKKRRSEDMSKFGIFGIPEDLQNFDPEGNNDDDIEDEDLEAELLALTSGVVSKPAKIARVKNNPEELNVMIAASLRDVSSEDEESVNENDPELLAELGNLVEEPDHPEQSEGAEKESISSKQTGSHLVSFLKDRLQMYEKAESNAKAAGETSRARRFGRGVKTLKEQLKQVSAGRVISEADIPPPVALGEGDKGRSDGMDPSLGLNSAENVHPDSDLIPASGKPPSTDNIQIQNQQESCDGILNTLSERRNAYRQEALLAKKNGDNETAIKFVRTVKQFDSVIAAVKSGQPVDLSEMPPMPHKALSVGLVPSRKAPPPPKPPSKEESTLVMGSEPQEGIGNERQPDPTIHKAPLPAPPAPTTVGEALEQRLQRFKEAEQSAKEEGNNSKARRLGRIVKQYQSAIAAHNSGKPIPFDELPTPPGFAPIPGQPAPEPSEASPANDEGGKKGQDMPCSKPSTLDGSVAIKKVDPNPPLMPTSHISKGKGSSSGVVSGQGQLPTRQERQLDILLKRQAVFKKAALEAKRHGDVAQAREHLRTAKGIDPLIEASKSGLPVDMDTLPLPPNEKASLLETDFDFVTADDCTPGSVAEIYEKLEEDLLKQVTLCMSTRDHFRAIGDVGSGNRFEQLALDSKKDLDAVRAASAAHKIEMAKLEESDGVHEIAPPRFHYENKTFSIVKCNTDLSDNDVELTIIRGINYNIPNDAETYVRFEFPYPAEYPQKDKTQTFKDNNPIYEHAFLLAMQRSSRPCQRIFKRHSLKLEVWSKGGFFRGDSLIGTANVKLQPLETKCTLHDSFPVMEGRKAIGGKVEVKIRLRNPILGRQVEKVTEKWLTIDKL